MDSIFQFVYNILKWISNISGLTYHEVNIIVYYMVIPALLFLLLSRVIKSRIPIIAFTTLVLLTVLAIPNFETFSTSLFDKSVGFLQWFGHIGLNYVQASVVICVFVPVLMIVALLYFKKKVTNARNRVP